MTRSLSAEQHPCRHDVSEDTHRLVIFLQTTRSGQSQMKGGVGVELKRRKEAKVFKLRVPGGVRMFPLSSPTDFSITATVKLTLLSVHSRVTN